MSIAFGFFVVTYFLKSYGEATVAAFGVTTRIEQIGLLPTMGLHAAIMALVGQNNGAGNHERIHETMRLCNRLGLAINLATSLCMFVFAAQLMRIFTTDTEVIEIGVNCLRIVSLIQWSYVMTSTHLAMLQATKRPEYGYIESVLRKILLPLPLLWLFVSSYEYGVDWVWYTVAATNVFMTAITIIYAQWVLRKLT
jgi:Na+-driven multidrug efflux pump